MIKGNVLCLDLYLVNLRGHGVHIHMGLCCVRAIKKKNRYSDYVISIKNKFQIISHNGYEYK